MINKKPSSELTQLLTKGFITIILAMILHYIIIDYCYAGDVLDRQKYKDITENQHNAFEFIFSLFEVSVLFAKSAMLQ